jgi:hypothetical protein
MPKQLTRERWLNKVATALTPTFKRLGHTVPPLRISTGFTSKGRIGSAVAECWTDRADADRKYQIFIDPRDDSPVEVINSVAHEIIHAAVGLKCGHRGDFAKVAKALGMLPPMPSTPSGPDFVALAEAIIAKVGPYPHAALQVSRKRPSTPADGAVVDHHIERPETAARAASKGRVPVVPLYRASYEEMARGCRADVSEPGLRAAWPTNESRLNAFKRFSVIFDRRRPPGRRRAETINPRKGETTHDRENRRPVGPTLLRGVPSP